MSELTDGAVDGEVLLKYLPAIYQEDEASRMLLEKFLSIFASNLQDCEDKISMVPRYFDPLTVHDKFLPWLAGWLALDLYELMGERREALMMNAVELYKLKGTARGLNMFVEMLTGGSCSIEEAKKHVFRTYREMDDIGGVSKTVNGDNYKKMGTFDDELHYIWDTNPVRIYSRNIVKICIFLDENTEDLDVKTLGKLIESFLPVFVRFEIVITNG